LSLSPDFAVAWANKGNTLKDLGLYDDAITHYDKALSLSPNIDWVYGDLVDVKLKICSWSDLTPLLEMISKKVIENENVSQPFSILTLNDDARIHKKSAEIYTQSKYPLNSALGKITKLPRNEKIRIAYFSADFKHHPVALLIAELFEIHDKSQFEIYAFSLVKACDAMRDRLQRAFDHFIDAEEMSDSAVAKLARDNSIDIAIDLSGFTQDSRAGIFSYRAAPIQVNYLGYPSTMGADYIDYIIADKTLVPSESQSHYSEKIAYLPNSYQVNDRGRLISGRQFTKQELGLPENGFVFCCFNNSFKILPSTFGNWMRILKAVEGSVVWLLRDNSRAVENLKKEAQNHGVDPKRLIFADRMPLPEHLARHRQADLFLDTLPYNAHTTASDALWAGLPVLTLVGRSFASRVAASLLNAIGLTELITSSQEEYEALALDLATDPQKIALIKRKLADNRLTSPLFDTPLFTKHLEAAYIKMYDRYQNELPPDHITII
jgi:predicted O-linked N-acetylglucosamine transferase (SPINDLY family)